MSAPRLRVGGRLLLIDDDQRVLLIHERIDDVGTTHWLTPGGGVEAGETPQQAAVREAWEETGLRVELPVDAPEVFGQRRRWSWQGVDYDQTDHLYLARVPTGTPTRPTTPTAMEQVTYLGMHWWSVAELRASGERFVPAEIADVVSGVLASGASA